MLSLTEEQRMLVEAVTDIAEREFSDRAFEWGSEVPWENMAVLAENGYTGLNFGEDIGGGGLTEFEVMLVTEAICDVCPDTARFFYSSHMVAGRAIDLFGTDTARERYLTPVIDGEDHVAIAISEPGAGSDVQSMVTTVEETDDGLVLDGEKMWVSFATDSDAAVVWTKFHEGLGSVIIEFDWDGVAVQENYTNMSGHTQTHFYMNDVHVPEEHVLTRGREGFKEQLKALNWERLGVASYSNSISKLAVDKAVEYAGHREQFDQPIGDFQGIEWKLADMVKQLEVSRNLTYGAAVRANEHDRVPDPWLATIAKLYSTEVAESIISEALQVHGANGYQQGHPLEYLYRLSRGYRIAGGTDEVLKNTLASMLKERGVPSLTDLA